MPQSRHRHKHPHHHQAAPAQQPRAAKTVRRSVVAIMIIFIGLLGTGVALLSTGNDPIWLLTGALAGGIAGYFIGRGMDRVATRNK
jgi:hypothetical protein